MTVGESLTWALHTDVSLDEVNSHLAALERTGLLGVAEVEGRATVYLPQRVEHLELTGRWEALAPRDWNAASRAGLEPVAVGRVTIVAPWHNTEDVDNDIVLVIEPAQAFGTGHHETTTACLAALQDEEMSGRSVFDVGTGTGVLALAATALGAARVLAVDIDPIAVDTARRNAVVNGADIDVRAGSTEAADGDRFDVVVANLDTTTLSRLAADVLACVAPGGTFIGSGISNERVDEAVAALQAAGAVASATCGREWALLRAWR